jgi:hypothetical protein
MECITTMPGTLTLASPWEAGIEENTYLAYVFAKRAAYVVVACCIQDGDDRGRWGLAAAALSMDLVQCDLACSLAFGNE